MIIRVVDVETSGLDPVKDAPCEVGWTDLVMGEDKTWRLGETGSRLCNPGRPIPPEVSAIHHITDDMVRGRPLWNVVVAEVCGHEDIESKGVVAFAAHNSRFERLWISDDLIGPKKHWLCTYRCALRLWPDAPSHSNQALRYWRGVKVDHPGLPHRAGHDSYVSALLLEEMLKLASGKDMVTWSSEPALLKRVSFGKHAGKNWSDVDTGYLRWAQGQDFDEDVRFTVDTEIARREPQPTREAYA